MKVSLKTTEKIVKHVAYDKYTWVEYIGDGRTDVGIGKYHDIVVYNNKVHYYYYYYADDWVLFRWKTEIRSLEVRYQTTTS